jgi:hypothetical protein
MARVLPDDLPLLETPHPIARAGDCCHVLAVDEKLKTMTAMCGAVCSEMCGDQDFERGEDRCLKHDEPLCDACVYLIEVQLDS